MQEQINAGLLGSIKAKQDFATACSAGICQLVESLVAAFQNGNKLIIFGNGGSAADAQHMAAEFVNRFLIDRRPLAALALTTDSSILTSIGNDFSFDDIFIKQIQALGKVGDIALGISTSGNSKNVLAAMHAAHENGMSVIALTGRNGGVMAEALEPSDIQICVAAQSTARIQEVHLLTLHCLCDAIDCLLLGVE